MLETENRSNNRKAISNLKLSEKERKVIELIRKRPYQTVTVKVQDGNIVHVRVEESIKP